MIFDQVDVSYLFILLFLVMPSDRRTLFRSIDGCTICRVKSARHQFKDSPKWVKYFTDVFKLSENRTSEICYLCLKSLNKWRRSPKFAKPDFSSIVDSKITKHTRNTSRKRRSSSLVEMEIGTKEENKVALMEADDALSENDTSDDDVDSTGVPDTYFDTPSPNSSVDEIINDHLDTQRQTKEVACQTSFLFPSLTSPQANEFKLPYIDLSTWRQEQICCSAIFRGPSGEVLVDPKWLNPSCGFCSRSCTTPTSANSSKEISIFDEKLVGLLNSST